MAAFPDDVRLHRAMLADLDAVTWHAVARVRQDVFVVEQACAYPELDERDAEPTTEHLWLTDRDGAVLAVLRVLDDGEGVRRIGRVATAPEHRGRRLMAGLLDAAIRACDGHRIDIDAQSYLEGWYGRFGFVRAGDEFIEDGIPHVPMVRPADARGD